MKVAYSHLIKYISSTPTIEDISQKLFQLGHENEIENGILDIEITPNRGDCLSLSGILRELSIFYKITNVFDNTYTKEIEPLEIDFTNHAPDICESISFLKIDIENPNGKYIDELKDYFDDMKIKKNNFFTDVSNFISYETGQPTHCYDFKKICGKLSFKEISKPHNFVSLLGKELKLSGNNPVFLLNNVEVINLAGVVGGESTSCSKETKSVLIECAYFNPESIIGKSLKYDIQSDAAYKFERGVDKLCHLKTLKRFLSIIEKHTKIIDVKLFQKNYKKTDPVKITFDESRLNNVIGMDINAKSYKVFFDKLGFELNNDEIISPSFRHDIFSMNDLAEEVARCIGYDNIPLKKFQINFNKVRKKIFTKETIIKEFLLEKGFYEIINFPFTTENNLQSITIDNPLDKNYKFMRTDLKESLLDKLIFNEKRQQDSIKLFEISDVYFKDPEVTSKRKIGIIASGRLGRNYINFSKKIDEKYFKELLTDAIATKKSNFELIDRKNINSKIKDKILYFESDIDDISENILGYIHKFSYPDSFNQYQKISEQPHSYRDLSFSIGNPKDFDLLNNLTTSFKNEYLKECFMFDYYMNEKAGMLKVAYRFIFQSKDKTLQENQVDKILNDIILETTRLESVEIPGMNL